MVGFLRPTKISFRTHRRFGVRCRGSREKRHTNSVLLLHNQRSSTELRALSNETEFRSRTANFGQACMRNYTICLK